MTERANDIDSADSMEVIQCCVCGACHEMPIYIGWEPPWQEWVPEAELAERVVKEADFCIVDNKFYFVQGTLVIPIIDEPFALELGVWSSLSPDSFECLKARWLAADRENDAPHYGYLSTRLPGYLDAVNLPLLIQSTPPGEPPFLVLLSDDHKLAFDQQNGISVSEWHGLVHKCASNVLRLAETQ